MPWYNSGKSPGCLSERLSAMRRCSPKTLKGETFLMYTAPKIIASLDATIVLAEALGCPSSIPNC